jgi:predicted acylesterase/phospholipase RssA
MRTRCLPALAGILFLFSAAAYASNEDPGAVPLRIGIVTFNTAEHEQGIDSSTQQLVDYFQRVVDESHVASKSKPPTYPRYDLQVAHGNYYQVLAWLRSGELDAAIVSPFTEYLLRHDKRRTFLPVLEFPLRDSVTGRLSDRHQARIAAYRAGEWDTAPLAQFDRYIGRIWSAAMTQDTGTLPDDIKRDFDVTLVNHLSTTAFLAPALYAESRLVRLKWRVDLKYRHEVTDRFWSLFFQGTHMTLRHIDAAPKKSSATQIFFRYNGDALWQPFGAGGSDAGFGNDALVVAVEGKSEDERRRALLALFGDLLDTKNPWHKAAKVFPGSWDPKGKVPVTDSAGSYYAVRPKQEAPYTDLVTAVDRAWQRDESLAKLANRWYVVEHYDFRAAETIDCVRQDQEIRNVGRTALVLPGGGVKGAYQAGLLDALYEAKLIANHGDSSVMDARLAIDDVIGTSGGALVGWFAAQRLAGPEKKDVLSRMWVDHGKVLTGPSTIFPFAGVPRWFTVWCAVMVFTLVVTVARADRIVLRTAKLVNGHEVSETDPPHGRMPVLLLGSLVLLLVLVPLVAAVISGSEANYVPTIEGLAYVVVALVIHYLLTCSGHPQDTGTRTFSSANRGGWGATLCGLAIMVGLMTKYIADSDPMTVLTPCTKFGATSVIAIAAFVIFLAGVWLSMRKVGIAPPASLQRRYGGAFLLLLLVIASAFLSLLIGWLLDRATTLELTFDYWIWTMAGAFLSSCAFVAMAAFGHGRFAGWVDRGLDFWTYPQIERRIFRYPIWSLQVTTAAALVLWTVLVAPGVYSGCTAQNTFLNARTNFGDGQARFNTNLIVTATSLGKRLGSGRSFYGDYYCCLDGADCQNASQRYANVVAFKKEAFPDAVFASGSPFPIFPALQLRLNAVDRGLFIDGGYTHNVPLQGAEIVGAHQVLIIRSQQREDHEDAGRSQQSHASPLLWHAANLLPFLFERSQEIDKGAAGRMFVASLGPDGPAPSLMDFRGSVVRKLQTDARKDFETKRIGRIENWGLPILKGFVPRRPTP